MACSLLAARLEAEVSRPNRSAADIQYFGPPSLQHDPPGAG
jgi:hypothetical protein